MDNIQPNPSQALYEQHSQSTQAPSDALPRPHTPIQPKDTPNSSTQIQPNPSRRAKKENKETRFNLG